MANQEKIETIEKYAPIVWIHADDAFLPEDCAAMEKFAKVGTSDEDMEPFTLDELGEIEDSKKYYLKIPEIDYNSFDIPTEYDGSRLGPEAIANYARQKLGNNPVLDPNCRESKLRYYARVSKIKIAYIKEEPFSEYYRTHDPGLFGDYNVIQYYFFYIFNDSWNQHVSDWDSTLELFIKEDNSRAYAILHMHHLSWMVAFSGKPLRLNEWISDWQKVDSEERMGSLFHFAVHPFVFVARGAHGGYPTPGYSIHGIKLLKPKIIAQTDYRQIGKLCIFPDYHPVTKEAILNILKEANIDTTKTKFLPWKEPIILDKQPWLKYQGLWGNRSEYEGWSGATGPACKRCWKMDQRRFKEAYRKAIQGDYSGRGFLKIFKNWHGWR